MIQRIQTLYLLAACILCVAALCLPLAHFSTAEGEPVATLYNLWMTKADGSRSFSYWALFALLLFVSTLSFMDIFLFRRRALQMRIASFSMILLVGWYVAYGVFVWLFMNTNGAEFRPHWSAAFPFASIVFLYLAFRGIYRDEQLVRSLDRLR